MLPDKADDRELYLRKVRKNLASAAVNQIVNDLRKKIVNRFAFPAQKN